MAQLKTSILLELQDKFSKQFKDLQKAMDVTKKTSIALGGSVAKTSKEFVTGGKEIQKFRNELKDTGGAYKELAKIIGAGFTASKLAGIVQANLAEAAKRQEIDANLNVVIDDEKTLPQVRKSIEKLAKSGLGTYEDYGNTAFSLLSAGVKTADIENATKRVFEVATTSEGNGSEVAMLMASLQQVYGLSFDRSGDLIAATQGASKFNNFAQLKESIEKSISVAKSVSMNENELFAIAGILNDNALEGSNAGTAINAVLRQLNSASETLGIAINRDSNGELDLVGFLTQMQQKLAPFDQDKKAGILQKIFGDEGKKGILPLLDNIDRLKEYQDDLKKNSEGFVDKKVQKFYELYNTKVLHLSESIAKLSAVFGNLLIPVATVVVEVLSNIIFFTAELIEKVPILGWLLYGVGGALAVLATRMLILRAIAIADFIFGFSKALVFARSAIMLSVGAMNFLKLAMLSNPFTAIMLGIATLATLIIMNWDTVKSWFVGFFDWLSNNGFFKLISSGIEMAKNLIGGDNNIAVSNEGVNKVREASMIGGNNSTSSNTSNNQVYNINVSGSQSPVDTAKEMSREVAKAEQLSMVGG